MPTSYTALLGLALPVTGELSGTWGDVVSNYITQYVDSAVAGTQTISGSQTAVTLSVTNGSSLVTAGSGSTGSAQFQIINCTGNPAGLLTITAPASSRQYIIINATSTSQSVKIVGSGPTTGVTILSGEKAHVAWNGSDFVKIATQNGNGDFVTVDTTNLEVTNIKAKDGTAAASIADSTGKITVTQQMTIDGIEVGQGAGNVSTNTAVGVSALAANTTGDENAAFGHTTLNATTTGSGNAAFGSRVLRANTTGNFNTALGYATLLNSTTGSYNTSVGASALQSNTTASNNTAVGYLAGYGTTTAQGLTVVGAEALAGSNTGSYNNAFGGRVLYANTSGTENNGFGYWTLLNNTTGRNNSAFGEESLRFNTTGSYNTAYGSYALFLNTTASYNTAVGYQASYSNTTGIGLVATGYQAGYSNTTGNSNSSYGNQALKATTTGSNNTAVGQEALASNTTASNNTAVGYQAGYSNTTGTPNEFFGYRSGYQNTTGAQNAGFGYRTLDGTTTGSQNAAFGSQAMQSNTTGANNTALGSQALLSNTTASNNTAVGYQAGYSGTTTLDNVFIGSYAGFAATTGTGRNVAVGHQAAYTQTTAIDNVAIGYYALHSATTGSQNVAIGSGYYGIYPSAGDGVTTGSRNTLVGATAGCYISTGSANTVLGGYNGNQGGLDIRTASNYIVLSDGDGKPMAFCKDTGGWEFGGQGGTQDGLVAAIGREANNYGPVFIGRTGSTALSSATSRWYAGSNSWVKGGTAYDTFTVAAGAAASGGVNLTSGATSWASASDARLKNVTGTYSNALSDIVQIQAVKFTWKADEQNKPCVGVIAQSVETVVPEAIETIRVSRDDETDYLSVKYTELIPLMIASIQELKAIVEAQAAEIATLKGN